MNSPENGPENGPEQGPQTPQGTIALLLVYLVIIVALWSNVYFTMISRGVVQ